MAVEWQFGSTARHTCAVPPAAARRTWACPRHMGIMLVVLALLPVSAMAAVLPPTIDLNVPPGTESAPVMRVYGPQVLGMFGSDKPGGAAFGDFNGDGFDDLVVGAPVTNPPGGSAAGGAFIVFGSAARPATQVDLSVLPGPSDVTRILGDDQGDILGRTLAVGDVNGDGLDDVILGADQAAAMGGMEPGRVFVIYGSENLPGTTVDLNLAPGTYGETRIIGEDPAGFFGYAVASGDIDNDGFDDVVIGAFQADRPGKDNAGIVYVVYGSDMLGGATIDLHLLPGTYQETRIYGAVASDGAGTALTTADVNGDGFFDVVIGAPYAEPPSSSGLSAGEVYIIYGSASLRGTEVDLSDPAGTYNETRIYGEDGEEAPYAGDSTGWSLASGDVNADGFDDLIIGAYGANAGSLRDAGTVYIIYGDASLPGQVIDLNTNHQITSFGETRILGFQSDDQLGFAVAAGDVNGDGYDDIIMGVRNADPAGGVGAGAAYVVYGRPELAATTVELATTPPDVALLGDNSLDLLGTAVAAGGDVDRDGFADFVATSQFGDNPLIGPGDNNTGYAATVFGAGDETSATVVERLAAGNTAVRGIGGRLSPVARFYAGFIGGDASQIAVTVVRNNAGLSGLSGFGTVGHTYWNVSTTRTGWVWANIELQYVSADITGLNEQNLALYQASDPAGPWTEVSGQTIDTTRQTIRATVDSLGYFALVSKSAPSVTIGEPSVTTTSTGPVTFPITYTGATTVNLLPGDVHLNTTGDVTGTIAVSGSGTTSRTVTVSDLTGNGTFTISIDAGTATDAGGNLAPAAGPSASVTVDTTGPSVSISQPTPNITVDGPITFTVSYTDAAEVTLASGDVQVVATGTATATANVSGSGTATRTVTLSNVSGNGTLAIAIAAGTATDALGNPAPAAGPSAAAIVTSDGLGVAIGEPSVTATSGGPVSFPVNYLGVTSITLDVDDVTLNTTGTVTGTVSVTGSGNNTRTVTISNITGDGTLGISIAAGTGTGLGGSVPAAGPSQTVVVDNTGPGIEIGPPSVDTTQGDPVTFTVTYTDAETITLTADDVNLITTGTATATVEVSGDGATRTVTLSNVTGTGTLAISINAGTATDALGNLAAAAGPSETVDATIRGDVNGDGVVNALDVQLVVNAVLGIQVVGNVDANGDGNVNSIDVQYVVNIILGVL